MKLRDIVGEGVAAVAVVGAATLVSRVINANAVTGGFICLIAILGLAIWQGFVAGTIGSLLRSARIEGHTRVRTSDYPNPRRSKFRVGRVLGTRITWGASY